jgi:hypothetical protein
MSAEGWTHGKELRVDFANRPSVEFEVQPDLKDIDGLYLWGWYAENCNTSVVKLKVDISGVDNHDVCVAVARTDLSTGASITANSNTETTTTIINDDGVSRTLITVVPVSQHENSIMLFPGLVAMQGQYVSFQAPKLLTDHKQHMRGINKLKLTLTALDGSAITFNRFVLDIRMSETNTQYINPGNRGLRF